MCINDTDTTSFYSYCPNLILHYALPFLDRAIDDVFRPLFEEWGGGLHRRDRLVEPARGLLHLDADALVDSLTRKFPAEGRWLAEILGEPRSEEHTCELKSLMRISYAVF